MRNTCLQNRRWHDKGLRPVQVAVNITGLQLHHPDFVSFVDQSLAESGLSPEYLELRITETMIMGAEDAVVDNPDRLKDRGIRLSIDEFDTGYASLGKLKQFPVDSLKINRSFIRDIADNPDDAAFVSAIIAMANSLELNVVAEGVESAEQLNWLIDRNCTRIQGYWFSKPLAAHDFEALLASDPIVSLDRKPGRPATTASDFA